MNFLNQFRSKEHDHAYQFNEKLYLKLLLHYSVIFLVFLATFGLYKGILEQGVVAGFLSIARTAIVLVFYILGIKVTERCIIQRRIWLVKCFGLVGCLIGLGWLTGFQAYYIAKIDATKMDPPILYFQGFYTAFLTSISCNAYPHWGYKWLQSAAICVIVIIKFGKDSSSPQDVIVGGLSLILVNLLICYKENQFSKQKFLEKYRLDQEARSLQLIIGDLSEGVLIYSQRAEKTLYQNTSMSEISFWNSNQSLVENLQKLQIVRVSEQCPKAASKEALLLVNSTQLIKPTSKDFKTKAKNLREFFESICDAATAEPRKQHYLIDVKFRNETEEYSYHIQLLSSDYGGEDAWAFIIRDTTERDMIITLQDNNEYKSRLLASVSHELRTPLNCSITFTEKAMEFKEIPSDIKNNYLKPSLNSCKLLLNLINDILDFSQIKAKKLRLVFEEKSIIDTVRECVELLSIQAEKKGIYLKMVGWESMRETIFKTDHNRVRQIILNLLSNAMKFTYNGGIAIVLNQQVRRVPDSKPQSENIRCIKISVKDTGIGIKPEDQAKLFKAFEKIDLEDRKSMNASGVGLGLVISTDLARSLGPPDREKPIEIRSEFAVGTTFEFEIMDQNLVTQSEITQRKLLTKDYEVEEFFEYSKVIDEGNVRISISNSPAPRLQGSTHMRSKRRYLQLLSGRGYETNSPDLDSKCSCSLILIVDDDMFNVVSLESLLHSKRLTTVSAFNGKIAIDKYIARENTKCGPNCRPFSLIFMDCNMPVVDGYEATRRLKEMMKKGEVRECPIIGCTALVQSSEVEKWKECGMDDCIGKPLKSKVLIQLLEKYGCESLGRLTED